MKVLAKCHNYAGCLQAYRGEEIELPAGAPLVCPECGKPLTVVKPPAPWIVRYLPALTLVALLVAAVIFGLPYLSKKNDAGSKPSEGSSGSNTTTSVATETPTPPVEKADPITLGGATTPEKIDLNIEKPENKKVKEEVLKRIDLMPNVSTSNKDKLYNSVERARSMGLVLTLPFPSGKMTVGAAEAQSLKEAMEKPEIAKLREDPTSVFVILGFADPKGDEKKNIAISQARADAVLEALRDKVGVNNVMHSVAMGGTTIVDAKNLEKNRIVEVWAVLP